MVAAAAGAQPPPPQPPPDDSQTIDVFDVWRKIRHKDQDSNAEPWDYHKKMFAFAPVIGAKPSSGVLLGAAGNVAFYRGDPATTRISSMVTSLTFSSKKQVAVTDRITNFMSGTLIS